MKNLFERLNANTLAKFEKEKEKYSATFFFLEKDLKENEYVGNLQFSTIINLNNHDVIDTYKLHEINKLFEPNKY